MVMKKPSSDMSRQVARIDDSNQLAYFVLLLCLAPDPGRQGRHDQRGRDALVGDIRDIDQQAAVRERNHVVKSPPTYAAGTETAQTRLPPFRTGIFGQNND